MDRLYCDPTFINKSKSFLHQQLLRMRHLHDLIVSHAVMGATRCDANSLNETRRGSVHPYRRDRDQELTRVIRPRLVH